MTVDMNPYKNMMQRYREAHCSNAQEQNQREHQNRLSQRQELSRDNYQSVHSERNQRSSESTGFSMEIHHRESHYRQTVPMGYGSGISMSQVSQLDLRQRHENAQQPQPWFARNVSDESTQPEDSLASRQSIIRYNFKLDSTVVHFQEKNPKVYRRIGEESSFISSNRNLAKEKVDKYFSEEAYLPGTREEEAEISENDSEKNGLKLQNQTRYHHQFLCETCFEPSNCSLPRSHIEELSASAKDIRVYLLYGFTLQGYMSTNRLLLLLQGRPQKYRLSREKFKHNMWSLSPQRSY